MAQTITIKEFIHRRNEILRKMDILSYVQLMLEVNDEFVTPNIAELVMHKARYELFSMPPELRQESREWLESRGYSRMCGLAWPPGTFLPENVK